MKWVNSPWFRFDKSSLALVWTYFVQQQRGFCLNHAVTMRVDYGVCYCQEPLLLTVSLPLSLSLCFSLSFAGRKGQLGRESESPYHQQKCPEEHASVMILSSYLFVLTGTSRSRQRGGCEGREGLPSKCCQSLPVCWHDCFADELCARARSCICIC